MKRLALILGLVLLLALAACDTMGPQEALPTLGAGTTAPEGATAAPVEVPAETEAETADTAGADLVGTTWEWVSLVDAAGQTTATDPARYTITFNDGDVANVVADCNTVIANYFTDGANITIEPGITSLVACPEDTQDQLFVNSLSSASSYVVEDGELFITLVGDSGTLMFRAAGTAGPGEAETPAQPTLTGTTWEWTESVTMVGNTAVADPTRYTITFNDDGTANIKADCNTVLANYTSDGSNLGLTLGPSTLVACPPDSQVNEFLAGLGSLAMGAYEFEGADLLLRNTAADGGVMRFRAAGSGEMTEPGAAGDTLTGVTWEWTESVTMLGATAVADPTRYTITFNDDGTANIKADCNNASATYTADETGALTLTLGPSTLMACPPDSQVNEFLAGLQSLSLGAYSFEDGALLLRNTAADGGAMHFRAAGGATTEPGATADTLTGVVWQWVATQTPVEEITVADPTRYTITFNEDGTAGIVADCNVGNATYTSDETGAIAITLGVSTLAFCENSQDQQFRTGLEAAAIYFFQDGDLYIDMFASSGTMRFANGGPVSTEAPVEQPTQEETLTGVTWQWTGTSGEAGEIAAADPTRYTITFNEDGTASISADCNVGTATYTADAMGPLTITPGAMTAAACPEDSQAGDFMAGLAGATNHLFLDGALQIQLSDGGTMTFSAAEPGKGEAGGGLPGGLPGAAGDFVGTVWQMTQINKVDGTVTFNDPTRYTISFNADGTANWQADCNVGGATYTGDDGALTITLGPSTMAFCGPGSLDQIFLGGLTNAMGYRLEGGNLLIDMLYESGTLVFAPAS